MAGRKQYDAVHNEWLTFNRNRAELCEIIVTYLLYRLLLLSQRLAHLTIQGC